MSKKILIRVIMTATYCTHLSQQQELPGGALRLFPKLSFPQFLILKQQQFMMRSSALNQFLVCHRFCNDFITHELFLETASRVLVGFCYFCISSPSEDIRSLFCFLVWM